MTQENPELVHYEAITEYLLKEGLITQEQATLNLGNYDYLLHQHSRLGSDFRGKWVAVVDRQVVGADGPQSLEELIDHMPHRSSAIMGLVGGGYRIPDMLTSYPFVE